MPVSVLHREGAFDQAPSVDLAALEFKLDELIAFRVVEGECVLEIPGEGGTKAFPSSFLPMLMQFVDWAPLSQAFLGQNDGGWPLANTVALLREFVDRGVLIGRIGSEPRGVYERDSQWRDVWAKWNPALAFFLSSRTPAGQPYYSLSELDEILWQKSVTEPQPSSYKDFAGSLATSLEPLTRDCESSDNPDDFLNVLLRRRTCRNFTDAPVRREDIERLLYLTWGATSTVENRMGEDGFLRKTSPSGGSLHPTEVYPLIMNVDGIERGIYHYSVRRHALERLSDEDPRAFLVDACGGQPWVTDAAAVFVMTSMIGRVAWKYEFSRAFRFVMLDVGHLSQTFYLVAAWLGLGAFVTGGLRDEILEQKLGINPLEEPLLLLNGVGVPAAVNDPSRPSIL